MPQKKAHPDDSIKIAQLAQGSGTGWQNPIKLVILQKNSTTMTDVCFSSTAATSASPLPCKGGQVTWSLNHPLLSLIPLHLHLPFIDITTFPYSLEHENPCFHSCFVFGGSFMCKWKNGLMEPLLSDCWWVDGSPPFTGCFTLIIALISSSGLDYCCNMKPKVKLSVIETYTRHQ